jgi:hypothetical protein
MKTSLYSDIIVKLNELLSMNKIEPVFQLRSTDPNSIDNIMKRQETLMDELKTLSRANNTLLGRVIRFQMADSYAVYVVTKVNVNTVRLSWVKWCDAWVDDRIGYEGNIDIDYINKKVQLEELFS